MSIAIKVPHLPYALSEARVGHWYKAVDELVARGEILVELLVRGEIVPVLAPQAGIVERIFFNEGETAAVGAILAQLKSGLPNLVWDSEQETLILDNYRAVGATESMEYALRLRRRQFQQKFGIGVGNLALPQMENAQQEFGMEAGEDMRKRFKANPKLKESSQFSGDYKDPRVTTIPANAEAQKAPQNAPTLNPKPQLGPGTPTLRPIRGG